MDWTQWGLCLFPSWDIMMSTAVFVLAVGCGWDDAIYDKDQ